MPTALNRDIRKQLETAVKEARVAAEAGARNALGQLGVADAKKPSWLTEANAALRVRLRAHARTLGDTLDTGDASRLPRLVREIAYAHWHRALFTRFLLEDELLVDVDAGNAPVRPGELRDIAEAEGKDVAEVAAEFAGPMLPEIFPKDDPVLALALPPETRQQLSAIVERLPAQTFKADDSLGWSYQFWQADRKKTINESEVKIGADELPAVTQLFTEDYMVLFLLENTLGAWWAGKKLAENPDFARDAADEDALRRALSPPGYIWTYLRFVREDDLWRPAAGTFLGWPARAAEITVLDPCMGSGHFLVFALDILAALRKAEEGLDDEAAVVAVLRDNLHGLEIDPRCTQIAAFALALAAWKRLGGVRALPTLHLACSGLAIGMGKAKFVRLAESIAEAEGFAGGPADLLGRERNPMEEAALARRRGGLEQLHDLFAQAPVLGSLIDPRRALGDFGTLFEEGFEGLSGVVGKVLGRAREEDADVREMAVTAQGLAKAAQMLSMRSVLVTTNVPYLGRNKMNAQLRAYIDENHSTAKAELAAAMQQRFGVQTCCHTIGSVFPQGIFFLANFFGFREWLLTNLRLNVIAAFGEEAWQAFGKRGPLATISIASTGAVRDARHIAIDATTVESISAKIEIALDGPATFFTQVEQRSNPDFRILFAKAAVGTLLLKYADSLQGVATADSDKFIRRHFEIDRFSRKYEWQQSTVEATQPYSGRVGIVRWDAGEGELARNASARIQGLTAHGHRGVIVSQMRTLASTIYDGHFFDNNGAAVVPKDPRDLAAIWAFASDQAFVDSVRRIDKKVSVTNATLLRVPFDLSYWQRVAAEKYPKGLPKPHSNDPTQWLFDGHPRGSADPNALDAEDRPTRPGLAEHPLHVAVARLLGYRWPRQTGSSFMDCPAIAEPDAIDRAGVIDADGIVCLPAIHGEAPAQERLRAVLMAAWGDDWGEGVVRACLEAEGWDKDLESWLVDGFFEGHCRLFHQTPFVWHIWDGVKGGFSALVNYHKLCAPGGEGRRLLEKLRDTYLGEWIGAQRRAIASDPLAEDHLAAALHLQDELTRIIEGAPPYDIFVRWKPLHEQPVGWEPDIDDGVRLNIRPFLTARPRGKAGKKACLLRVTPGVKKHEGADRGGEPDRAKADYPWFWAEDHDVEAVDFAGGPAFKGRRYNNFHYSRAFKQAARARQAGATPGSEAAE